MQLKSAVLVGLLFLGFTSVVDSRPIAVAPTPSGAHAIVLTDDTHEACPETAHAAVLYDMQNEEFLTTVLGCWALDRGSNKIYVYWMNSENDETFVTSHDADSFKLLQQNL